MPVSKAPAPRPVESSQLKGCGSLSLNRFNVPVDEDARHRDDRQDSGQQYPAAPLTHQTTLMHNTYVERLFRPEFEGR